MRIAVFLIHVPGCRRHCPSLSHPQSSSSCARTRCTAATAACLPSYSAWSLRGVSLAGYVLCPVTCYFLRLRPYLHLHPHRFASPAFLVPPSTSAHAPSSYPVFHWPAHGTIDHSLVRLPNGACRSAMPSPRESDLDNVISFPSARLMYQAVEVVARC